MGTNNELALVGSPMALYNKSKMAPAAILYFGKTSNSGLDKDICTTFYGKMHHGHAEMTT